MDTLAGGVVIVDERLKLHVVGVRDIDELLNALVVVLAAEECLENRSRDGITHEALETLCFHFFVVAGLFGLLNNLHSLGFREASLQLFVAKSALFHHFFLASGLEPDNE